MVGEDEKIRCDICLNPRGEVRFFKTYQPTSEEYEGHFVCEKCVNGLVEKYFNRVNVL